ncbi:MAG: TIGR01440 family protein [Thermaerobacter sp.]|nr:TIGR01440 family protein [Thermaerobacter sp.]
MEGLKESAEAAFTELVQTARLRPGDVVVVGGSSSEVQGQRIGSASALAVGEELYLGLHQAASATGVELAVQCCEHLNRAIVVRRAVCRERRLQEVTAVPVPGAGGALAAAYYQALSDEACLVASIAAEAGIDIGDTLIGMHLRPVAVPVRLSITRIGAAHVVAARTRPPLIGGPRAHYPEGTSR